MSYLSILHNLIDQVYVGSFVLVGNFAIRMSVRAQSVEGLEEGGLEGRQGFLTNHLEQRLAALLEQGILMVIIEHGILMVIIIEHGILMVSTQNIGQFCAFLTIRF